MIYFGNGNFDRGSIYLVWPKGRFESLGMRIDWFSGSVPTVAGRPIRVWRYMGARVGAHTGRLRTGQKPQEDKNGVAQEAYQYVLAIYFWPKKESGVEKILESPSNPDTKLNF